MKIEIDKNLVQFFPETEEEKSKIQQLWQMVVDCNGFNKKMVAVGEYSPTKNHNSATFFIEDIENVKQAYNEIHVDDDCRCYCAICNKFVDLKKGDPIPLCCGKTMEIID